MGEETSPRASSLVRQLKYFVTGAALFFVLGFLGIFFSSQNFLLGLTKINTANNLMTVTTQATEGLGISSENLQKLLTAKDIGDTQYVFLATQKQIDENIQRALNLSSTFPEISRLLKEAQNNLLAYKKNVDEIFKKTVGVGGDVRLQEDLLVAKQLSLEVGDELRRVQISLQKENDDTFRNIFKERYHPLFVAVALAILFSTIVLIGGFYAIRRFDRSIKNLTRATDLVARGDLNFQAEILDSNEIGHVTKAFNQMIKSLQAGREKQAFFLKRVVRLQEITATFSKALRPDEVLEATVREGLSALGASHAAVGILSEDGTNLEMKKYAGYDKEVLSNWPSVPITDDWPITKAVRTEKLVVLESREDTKRQYPFIKNDLKNGPSAFVAIPLTIDTRILGAVGLGFSEPRKFSDDDKAFILAIFQQCAQALHRSQLYEDAQDAIQARDEFLSIASHELRTPLTPLKLQLQSFIQHLDEGTLLKLPKERLARIAETSDRQVTRLANLIENLLDVSRISAGKLRLSREKFNLSDMLQEVISRYRQQLDSSGCKIEVKSEPNIIATLDRLRIEQVVVNLITNAAKYAPGHPIFISLSKVGEIAARLIVKDEGPGIAAQDQERIFKRFERVRTRDNVGGLGLGLYISKQITEAHGGKIIVISELGHGATFIVDLPLNEELNPGAPISMPEKSQ